MKGITNITRTYVNPMTDRTTEIIVYHAFNKITVTTQDHVTIDFIERLNNVLKKLRSELSADRKKHITNYKIQILSI